jgi:hypothetical protein
MLGIAKGIPSEDFKDIYACSEFFSEMYNDAMQLRSSSSHDFLSISRQKALLIVKIMAALFTYALTRLLLS